LTVIAVTWNFLITSIIIFFGTIIGFGMALKKISRLNFVIITVFYALSVVITLFVLSLNISLVYKFINQYIPGIVGILGLLILLAGIFTIKNWRNNKKITYVNNPAFIIPVIGGILGIISVYSLLIGPNPENTFEINLIIFLGLLFTISIGFGVSKFLKRLNKPYPIIISNFMVLVGFYFIIFAAFIPNIATLSAVNMDPLYLRSTNYLVFLLLAVIGIFLCGVFMQNLKMQKNTLL
jgi:predicted transporter